MNDDAVVAGRIYSGDEAAASVRALAERRKNAFASGDAITTGIPFVDAGNPALTRGDIAVVVGLTSEGKSMFATSVAKHTIEQIKLGQRTYKSAVVYVLTEETVEARRTQLWGDRNVTIRSVLSGKASLLDIDKNIAKSIGEPLYFIGDCAAGDVDVTEDNTFGVLTVPRIAASIQILIRSGILPELVIIDHVGDLALDHPVANEAENFEQVARQVVQLSSWLRSYCPLLAIAQAKKEVMSRDPSKRLPTKYDLKFMAALAARARDIHALWYPAYHMEEGAKLKTSRMETSVAKGTFVSQMAKGRYSDITGQSYLLTAYDDEGNWSGMLREIAPRQPSKELPRQYGMNGDRDA